MMIRELRATILTDPDWLLDILQWELPKKDFERLIGIAGKGFDGITELEKEYCAVAFQFVSAWVDSKFIPRILNAITYAATGETHDSLLEQAKAGNDESLFIILRLFKDIERGDWLKERGRRAALAGDKEFLAKVKEAVAAPAQSKRKNLRFDLYLQFILKRELFETWTPERIQAHLLKIGFKRARNAIEAHRRGYLLCSKEASALARWANDNGFSTGDGTKGRRTEDEEKSISAEARQSVLRKLRKFFTDEQVQKFSDRIGTKARYKNIKDQRAEEERERAASLSPEDILISRDAEAEFESVIDLLNREIENLPDDEKKSLFEPLERKTKKSKNN